MPRQPSGRRKRLLTPEQVRDIRKAVALRKTLTGKALAAKHGVSVRTLRDVVANTNYAWVSHE